MPESRRFVEVPAGSKNIKLTAEVTIHNTVFDTVLWCHHLEKALRQALTLAPHDEVKVEVHSFQDRP